MMSNPNSKQFWYLFPPFGCAKLSHEYVSQRVDYVPFRKKAQLEKEIADLAKSRDEWIQAHDRVAEDLQSAQNVNCQLEKDKSWLKEHANELGVAYDNLKESLRKHDERIEELNYEIHKLKVKDIAANNIIAGLEKNLEETREIVKAREKLIDAQTQLIRTRDAQIQKLDSEVDKLQQDLDDRRFTTPSSEVVNMRLRIADLEKFLGKARNDSSIYSEIVNQRNAQIAELEKSLFHARNDYL